MFRKRAKKLPEVEGLPEGVVLRFVRTGGMRPTNDELVLVGDGRATITRGIRRQPIERTFAPESVRQVLGELVLAGFFEMDAEIGEQVPDGYAYEVTVRSGDGARAVVTYDGSVPPALAPVLATLRGMLRS